MKPKPSKVHECSPPPGDELAKLNLRAGDVWICPVCGDSWQLRRGVQPAGLLPVTMQKPEWLRLNDPQYHTASAPSDLPDESDSQPQDPGNQPQHPPPSG